MIFFGWLIMRRKLRIIYSSIVLDQLKFGLFCSGLWDIIGRYLLQLRFYFLLRTQWCGIMPRNFWNTLLQLLLWEIWKSRNRFIFQQQEHLSPEDIFFESFNLAGFYTKCKYNDFLLTGLDIIRCPKSFFNWSIL